MNKIRIGLLAVFVISILAGYGIHALSPERSIDEKAILKELAPELTFGEKEGTPPHYISDEGMVAFNTYDITPSVKGYAGPIKSLVLMNRDGKIAGISIIDHSETRNYVHAMETSKYLKQFVGKSVNDPFVVDKDVDGISRATVSVHALTRSVRDSSRTVASGVFGLKVPGLEEGRGGGYLWLIPLALYSASFAIYLATRRSKRILRMRDVSLVLGVAILGFYLSIPFSILHIFNLILLRPSSSLLWYIVVIGTIASITAAGRFYCGWLCPFGALSEFIGRLPFRKWQISTESDDRWRTVKYWIMGLVMVIVFVSRKVELGNYETYVTLFSYSGHFLAWSLVILSLVASIMVERFWCRYLCPVAAFTGLLSRKDDGYVSRPDCPMGNKQNPEISECIRCNRCYSKGLTGD